MRNRIVFALLPCVCALAVGCSHTGIKATHSGDYSVKPTNDQLRFSWALPKTTFDVDATWTFKRCVETKKGPQIVADAAINITPIAVADPSINFVYLDVAKSSSFWQDHSFDVHTAPGTHLLLSFNSSATNQTGPILGNFIKGAVAIAGVLLLSDVHVISDGSPQCGDANQAISDIASDQAKLQKMSNQTSAEAKKLLAAISSNQQRLVIKLDTLNIDPGVKPKPENSDGIVNGVVGTLRMPAGKLQKNGWLDNPSGDDKQLDLVIKLDFDHALPGEFKKAGNGPVTPVKLSADGLWREVAYIPVEAFNKEVMVGKPTTLPFAQFGASRTLPLDAPAFGKVEWTMSFNEFGEVTEAKWGSQATGTGVSQLFADSMSAANSIEADAAKAPPTDRKTLELQAENTQLDAVMNNSTKKLACQDMLAKGQVDSCP